MIFRIRRTYRGQYWQHCETGEMTLPDTEAGKGVPFHFHMVDDSDRSPRDKLYGINKEVYHQDHEWEPKPGPMPILGQKGDTVEISTIDELCQLVKAERYPIIITQSNDDDGASYRGKDCSWTLVIYDGHL